MAEALGNAALRASHPALAEESLAKLAGREARVLAKDPGEVALRGEAQARGYGGSRHLGVAQHVLRRNDALFSSVVKEIEGDLNGWVEGELLT